MNGATLCFHCGLPVTARTNYSLQWEGETRAFCCAGCEAVAHAIIDAKLDDYYRRRDAIAPKPQTLGPELYRQLTAYDHPSLQRSFVRDVGDRREATLILEGIHCPACVWLNERRLQRLPGVSKAEVNYATRRARVVWDDRVLHLSDILAAVAAIGYRAHPYDPARLQQVLVTERRTLLRQLGVAGIFGAQVMTLAEALYFGDWSGSDPLLRGFLSWISLVLTLPVLLYAARPFLRGALNDLRLRRIAMDVPIALSLVSAFTISAWSTVTGQGAIYYDAVTMFVFLLLGARYFEQTARARAAQSAEALVQAAPALAVRLQEGKEPEQIAVVELERGDRVLVRPGETIPADGTVLDGKSSVDESLLTGESVSIAKKSGDRVIGGSINVESPLTLRVDNVRDATMLSALLRLLDRATAEKPPLARMADRIAAALVTTVMVLAIGVGIYWWLHDATRLLPIVISVLIVTCPCALGLAIPTALSAATSALTRRGLLVTRGHALETLARVTHVVFDKTGTLTTGALSLSKTEILADRSLDECVAIAATLEQHAEHPIAQAFLAAAQGRDLPVARHVLNHPGEGITGEIAGERYALGTLAFVKRSCSVPFDPALIDRWNALDRTIVALGSNTQLLAVFILADTIRRSAADTIARLKQLGISVALLTGDRPTAAARVARDLGIDEVRAALKPGDKLAHVQALQRQGAVVAMVGDGINDAPVLAGASVSIAVNRATPLAASSADMILLSSDLRTLIAGLQTARRTRTVVRENLAWAVTYNILAIPAACFGFVTPWMAALGMSASSLIVVLNALRLTHHSRETGDAGSQTARRLSTLAIAPR